jgi:N-acetylneuraminic acid mutarotase
MRSILLPVSLFCSLVSTFPTDYTGHDDSGPTPTWTELAGIARGPRQEQGVAAVGTNVYIVGGIPVIDPTATNDPSLDLVDVYSTVDNTWHAAAPIPKAINHGNVVTVNNKVYVLGALAGDIWIGIPNCYEYTPETNTWETLPPMPSGQGRGASSMGVHGSTVYIAGGLILLNGPTGEQVTVTTVSSYNVETKEWTTLPNLPEGRDHVGGAVIGDIFYVVGGRIDGIDNVRNTVFALDLKSPQNGWVQKAPMPTARGGLMTSHIDSVIYTFGGEGNRTLIPNGVYNEVEAYDTESDSWTQLSPMPKPRHGTGAAMVGRCIFIPGGGNVTGAAAVTTNDKFCI